MTPAYGGTSVGGLAVSAERIVSHLASIYSISVITPSELLPPSTYRANEIAGIEVIEVGKAGETKLFLQFLADVIETVSRPQPEPLFLGFYCNSLAYATTLAARRRGGSSLLFTRGNDIDLDLFAESAFAIHYALSHARKVFCVSREMEAKVRAFCPNADTQYIANGVVVERFPFQQDFRPAHHPVIGLFGDIKQKKGLELLLAAIDFDRFSLRIVGRLREEASRLLHGFLSLHPQARVSQAPYVHEPEALLAQYHDVDIVCIPSTHEGMSNVMLEAMAIGKLCVCSAVGGARDVIRDGENGFLFEPYSAESLSRALARAQTCLRGEHETLRRQACATIQEEFSAAQEREHYLQAIQVICS